MISRDLKSFVRRHIQIAAGPTDVVLGLGNGDELHWRADVLLEVFLGQCGSRY
jgi:hypothetical protein